jgi:indole-3-glycerol phosphate synthase
MSDFLKTMAASSRARADAVGRRFTDDDLDRPAFPLELGGFDLVAEIKNRSPAEGELSAGAGDHVGRARQYVAGGAAAISVLTEPDRFDGELSHLEAVVDAVADDAVPVMRKDFLVDPVQVLEAKAAGASGVLLIAAMFDVDGLKKMLDCAFEHDLFVLLESFDDVDLEVTAHLVEQPQYRQQAERNKLLAGVNTRNLRTLAVDPDRLRRLGPSLPWRTVCVAESGLHTAEDAAAVTGWGYRMALVGTALMRAADPAKLIADMLAAGRAA